ncbi:MAG: prepilin peptidase [Candidatus Promineofilum sp.]|nr:prepilin peptidase [Promineifilum sp.]
MSIGFWGLLGLFAAVLINRAADCWLSPAKLSCNLTRHPWRTRLVGVGVPATFVLLAWPDPLAHDLPAMLLMGAILILLAVIDWEQRRVPNVIVLPATAAALLWAWAGHQLFSAAAGAGLAFAFFLALYALGYRLFGPGALGMGDVKLAALIGSIFGVEQMAYVLALGILLAGAAAAGLLMTRRARRGDALPFGHFMALAAVAALLATNWRL